MAKRHGLPICPLDERRFNEGRGQGDGPGYRPWVSRHDESSSGFSTCIMGVVTGREHHFQTDGETDYFRILDLCPQVRDIKEKFPLSLEATVQIAEALGIPHPRDHATGTYRVMTTDFLVTTMNGLTVRNFARSYRKSESLRAPEALRTLEIERQYWRLRHTDWGIVTEREVAPTLIANAKFIHGTYQATSLEVDYDGSGVRPLPQTVIHRIAAVLTPDVLRGQTALNVLTEKCDETLGIKPGISLLVAKHLLAQRQWPVDFRRPLEPWAPLPLLKSGDGGEQGGTV